MKFRKLKALVIGSLFMIMSPVEAAEMLTLNINASHYLHVGKPITRIATGSPEIIGVVEVGDTKDEILIVAKNPGATSMLIWTADGQMKEYVINVSPEDKGLAYLIEKAINLPNVQVKAVKDRILLSGTVKNQYEREYAIKIAQLYVGSGDVNSISNSRSVGANRASTDEEIDNEVEEFESSGNDGNIIDLLQLEFPTQVQFEAQIIDIDENDAKDLGIDHPGSYAHNETGGSSHPNGPSFANNPYKWFFTHRDPIDFTIRALVAKGKARILSRPYITTMSGEPASIHIGGTVPVQVRDSDGGYSVDDKEYGIILHIVPNVDAKNKITSSVTAIVSSIDESHSTSTGVALIEREATAVISVDSGNTMVIGGLLDSRDSKSVSKIPLLGDIPILGNFFKYTSKSKEHRELLILITPTLVTQDAPAKMSEPLQNYYDSGRQMKADLNEVDVNAAPPPRSINAK